MKILGTNLTNKGYNVSSKIGTAAINRVAIFNDTAGNIKDSGFTIESSVPANAKFTDTVYTHPTTAGNKHVPSGGASGQLLKWSAAGTAAWATITPADIGAAASSHTHNYLPSNGGTLTDSLTFKNQKGGGDMNSLINCSALSQVTGNGQMLTAADDRVFLGNPQTKLVVESSHHPIVNVNGTTYTMYHTGNKPTAADIGAAASSHTHNYIPTSASCNKNWNWSGQSGQPTWLWGGEDGTNMYVYNPQNFTVNYSHNTGKINGKNVFIQTGKPTAQTAGDLWISW